MNLNALSNVSGVFTGFNLATMNNTQINISNMSTNYSTFSIFGSQTAFNAVQVSGNLTNGLAFTGFIVTKTQTAVQYQCVQIQLVVNIASTSVLYFF